jgi:hypothetical protein
MKSIVIGATIVAAFTSLAQADEVMGKVRDSHAQMQPRAHKSSMVSSDVVVDGRVVGRDPSQVARATIANQYYSLSAAGGEGGAGGDAGGAAAAD